MKKLTLVTAIAAVLSGGSASAATIYDKDGLSYKMKGDWQIQLRQKPGDDNDLNVEFDDLEIKNSVAYALGDDMTAFGQLDFGFKNAADAKSDGSHLEEAYVGLGFGNVAVRMGKQAYASDEFGVHMAIENYYAAHRFDEIAVDGDDVIRLDVEMDNMTFIVSTEIEADSNSSDVTSTDLFLATKMGGVDLGLAYQMHDPDVSVDGDDIDTWGISAAFDFDAVELGLDYSDSSNDGGADSSQLNLAAGFSVAETTKMALGVSRIEEDGSEDVLETYANVTYKFPEQKNVKLFAEVTTSDEDNVDAGFLAGMNIKF